MDRERGLTINAELLLKQSHTVQKRDWAQRYRRLRLKTYDFLDHPTANFTVSSVLYHISAFLIVLTSVILGASADSLRDHQWVLKMYSVLETSLAVFFLLEFLVRMWAISADAKYMGFKGHFRYLTKFVCITDITIIVATFAILLMDKSYVSDKTMDVLRFVQIMRLFHIDRQMTTWRLIKNMVIISKKELLAAYYITFVLFVLMANLVYYSEHFESHHGDFFIDSVGVNDTQISTLAHAWWFSVVTITTIGYGDLVPTYWYSKIIVCVLGFLAYCTFVTASTQISVGLTLMMEEDNKNEYKKRLKHAAAAIIQNWWRYHMASALLKDNRYRTTYFKDCCYKLYLTAENLSKMRAFEKKVRERRDKKRRAHKLQQEWKNSFRLGASTLIQPTGIQSKRLSVAERRITRHMSMPVHDTNAHPRMIVVSSTPAEEMSKLYHMKMESMETTVTSSCEGSDSEQSFPLLEEPFAVSAVDEKLLIRYKPLLRFIFFLVFQIQMKKFQRLRKADKLLEMEAEIVEQIHERDQKLNELEVEFARITGKMGVSILDPQGERHSVLERIELCENKMGDLAQKAEQMNELANMMLSLIEGPGNTSVQQPPPAPGRFFSRRLRRQSRTTVEEEDELV